MKKIFILTIVLLSGYLNSQEDYTIKMTVKAEGLPIEYAALGEQEIVTYLKGVKSKTEVNSTLFSTVVYYDGASMTSLTDAMGNKTGFTATKKELEAEENEQKNKPKITYTKEKKNIAGFECTKAIIINTGEDNKPEKSIVWITDKIKSESPYKKSAGRGTPNFGDLKGYPLAMEMSKNYDGSIIKMIMTATEVSTKKINENIFIVSTEGYQMMGYGEMKEKMRTSKGK